MKKWFINEKSRKCLWMPALSLTSSAYSAYQRSLKYGTYTRGGIFRNFKKTMVPLHRWPISGQYNF